VELRPQCIGEIHERLDGKVQVKGEITDFAQTFDVITLFHVLEHLEDQVAALQKARSKLKAGGVVIIEVPHARDVLISVMRLKAFFDFTFWSEHLVLHTRESLTAILRAAGFGSVDLSGYQRYGLGNHFGWLQDGKPGGHVTYRDLEEALANSRYEQFLHDHDWTDTLLAVAHN
jgi:SAM-dependent methyltransferase